MKKMKPADINMDLSATRVETLKVVPPPERKGGGKVASVDELVAKLKEAGAI